MDSIDTINSIAANKKVVFTYFGMFSRFEYALKRSGFVRDANGHAEAHWDNYANSLRGQFSGVKDAEFQKAVGFLKREAPKKQILQPSGDLDWADTPQGQGESDEQYVLRLTRAIRNNLFHGGKFPSGPVSDVARNRELLDAGITVMTHC
jgi:hypothetical protein